jgi:hypothetical protein
MFIKLAGTLIWPLKAFSLLPSYPLIVPPDAIQAAGGLIYHWGPRGPNGGLPWGNEF